MTRLVLGNSSLARYPRGGGHWTVFLQYLLGLDALGCDVLYLELMHTTGDSAEDESLIEQFFARLEQYGLRHRAALLLCPNQSPPQSLELTRAYGKTHAQVKQIAADADILWNFCAALRQPLLSLFRRRAFIDLDPGHLQISALQWEMEVLEHDVFLSVGSKMADADCEVPRLGVEWQPFAPFVYLPMWTAAPDPGSGAAFTSITHWGWDELWLNGRRLSTSKREAYLSYIELPKLTGKRFQLAANIHPEDVTGDRELLSSNGWELVHPYNVAGSPEQYCDYIAGARGEILCPKPIYRELKTGWLSDRSACYLASARPVLTENTGAGDHFPTGEGLLIFNDMHEAVAGVAEIDADYERHSRVARELAEQYLDSSRCLSRMIAACA